MSDMSAACFVACCEDGLLVTGLVFVTLYDGNLQLYGLKLQYFFASKNLVRVCLYDVFKSEKVTLASENAIRLKASCVVDGGYAMCGMLQLQYPLRLRSYLVLASCLSLWPFSLCCFGGTCC